MSLTEYIFLTYNINILTEVRAWERRKLALSRADATYVLLCGGHGCSAGTKNYK